MEHRVLGRTGRSVSILGLGGAGMLTESDTPEAAAKLVNRAIDLGINYRQTTEPRFRTQSTRLYVSTTA